MYKRVEYNELEKDFIGDSFNDVMNEYVEWLCPNYELIYNEHYVDQNLKHRMKIKIKYKIN